MKPWLTGVVRTTARVPASDPNMSHSGTGSVGTQKRRSESEPNVSGDDEKLNAESVAERVGQLGWVARGVSYVVMGIITIRLAVGSSFGTEEADQAGALQALSNAPGGTLLLLVLAVGLGIFAAWQAAQLFGMGGIDISDWLERLAKASGIFFYGSLVWTAIEITRRGQSSEGSWTVDRISAWALQNPAGRVAVAAAGVVVIAIAGRRGRRTVTGDLDDDLDLDAAGPTAASVVEWLGRAGEVGRAISFMIIGGLLVSAALQDRPSDAGGLDQSLTRAASSTFGEVLVFVTGVGFVLFGAYSVGSARYRRLEIVDAS